jgi:transposase-like protein
MSKKRKVYSTEFKAKLVLEVLEGINTVNHHMKSISSLRSGYSK